MDIDARFAPDYPAARTRLREAAIARGLAVETHTHPSARGAQGEALTMDVVRIGAADAPRLAVVTSAVHGVEGFCGSGAQVALLCDDDLQARARQADVALLLVHAVNPYGFSHLRRVNEDGIDLNRNRLPFDAPLPANPAYATLHPLLVPDAWPPTPANVQALGAQAQRMGAAAFQAAVTTGQSTHPDGLFYTGTAPSWSSRTLADVVGAHGRAARHLAWMDVHTGLGPFGHGEKIYAGGGGAAGLAHTRAIWGADVMSTSEGESASADVRGPLVGCAAEVCPHATAALVALEFGTVPLQQALDAIRGDHWLAVHAAAGTVPPALQHRIKQTMRDAFYCDTTAWRAMVVGQVRVAVLQACAGLGRMAA